MATVQAVLGNLSVEERHVLTAVNTGASTLSLLGSGFIVLCYLCFKELRKFSFKLVFFLALSDMLCSFFSIVGDPSKGFFCYAQGYSTHFFCVASFLWTTTIAFTLHRTVVRHKADVEDFEPMFHLYVWGTSLVMTVLRSIGNEHGHVGHIGRVAAWCWTETGRTGKATPAVSNSCEAFALAHNQAVHFFTFYTPLWGAILFNGITYFQVIRMLNNATRMAVGMSDRGSQSDTRADMKVLMFCFITSISALNRWGYYPLILIGSWSFGTVNRIHDFIEPDHKIFWLSVFDVGMAALMGLFNSIAYGLNSSVRRAIYERLDLLPESIRRWFPKKLKSRSQQQQHESELVSLRIEDQRQ
ncbi:GCR1-cAMP receptor [Cynara cardunculus var. scolymus]|uniref:GCR1-cAMP receptor n=1 Tax=Cynara cardunculus var. scolymus TaxID=59895 RepID=A0A103YMN9_CYNCS|nr:GCR1-cAMP receptor [Cynara cardunculus var. scolymus]